MKKKKHTSEIRTERIFRFQSFVSKRWHKSQRIMFQNLHCCGRSRFLNFFGRPVLIFASADLLLLGSLRFRLLGRVSRRQFDVRCLPKLFLPIRWRRLVAEEEANKLSLLMWFARLMLVLCDMCAEMRSETPRILDASTDDAIPILKSFSVYTSFLRSLLVQIL